MKGVVMKKCGCRLPLMDGVITCYHPYKHKGIDSRNFHAGFVPGRVTHLPKGLKVEKHLGLRIAYWKVKNGEL